MAVGITGKKAAADDNKAATDSKENKLKDMPAEFKRELETYEESKKDDERYLTKVEAEIESYTQKLNELRRMIDEKKDNEEENKLNEQLRECEEAIENRKKLMQEIEKSIEYYNKQIEFYMDWELINDALYGPPASLLNATLDGEVITFDL